MRQGSESAGCEHERAIRAFTQHYSSLVNDAGPVLRGDGSPDGGAAQLGALRLFDTDEENILAAADHGAELGLVETLSIFAFELRCYLTLVCKFGELQRIAGGLLARAQQLDSARLELLARLALIDASRATVRNTAVYRASQELTRLAREHGDGLLLAEALAIEGALADHAGSFDVADALLAEAQAERRRAGQPESATYLSYRGGVAYNRGDMAAAHELWQEMAALARATGDGAGLALALHNVAVAAVGQGHSTEAAESFRAALQLAVEYDRPILEAYALANLLELEARMGDLGTARSRLDRALWLARSIGSWRTEIFVLRSAAELELLSGDAVAAGEALAQVLQQDLEDQAPLELARDLVLAGRILGAAGHWPTAAMAWAGAEQATADLGSSFPPTVQADLAAAREEWEAATGLAGATDSPALDPVRAAREVLKRLKKLRLATLAISAHR